MEIDNYSVLLIIFSEIMNWCALKGEEHLILCDYSVGMRCKDIWSPCFLLSFSRVWNGEASFYLFCGIFSHNWCFRSAHILSLFLRHLMALGKSLGFLGISYHLKYQVSSSLNSHHCRIRPWWKWKKFQSTWVVRTPGLLFPGWSKDIWDFHFISMLQSRAP